ncbi:DUF3606 domain-containing protein [Mesorhizobium sp. LNHC221B00]|uniref:DUF3606 domain-containing protein n=1 Tax=Mesorhizobium sp. LNHC221B00 TaxID=1287233 RepID=UPI0012EC7DE9|nr:DUF3606 domain-containing protein [Mesorhizobium sp. LNHC221B00]
MADDKSKRDFRDRDRVSTDEGYEVEHFATGGMFHDGRSHFSICLRNKLACSEFESAWLMAAST